MTSVLESPAFQVARTHYQLMIDKETDGVFSISAVASSLTHVVVSISINPQGMVRYVTHGATLADPHLHP